MRSVIFVAALAGLAAAPTPKKDGDEELREAIQNLDHPQFRVRNDAAKRLFAAGVNAIEPLCKVAEKGSAESADRAMKVLEDLANSGDEATQEAARVALRRMVGTSPRAAEILNRHRSHVLDKLSKAGAHFQFDGEDVRAAYFDKVEDPGSVMSLLAEFPELTEFSASNPRFTDAHFKMLMPLKNLRWINLFESSVGDESMKLLREFKNLESVPMGRTRVTDEGLKNLGNLKNLDYLGLRGNKVTDAGLAHLKGLENLKGLTLEETAVTGSGFAHLQDLKALQNLRLMGSALDDEGLKHLHGIKSLRDVDVQQTKVTAAGCEKLRQANPDLNVRTKQSDE